MQTVGKIASGLGTALGAASVIILLQQGLSLGFVAPLQVMIDWYGHAVDLAFRPVTPIIEWFVDQLGRQFPGSVVLNPAWRHLFLVAGMMTGAIWRGSASLEGRVLGVCLSVMAFGHAVLSPAGQVAMGLLWAAVLIPFAIFAPASWRGPAPTSRELRSQLGQIASVFIAVLVFVTLNAGLGLAGL